MRFENIKDSNNKVQVHHFLRNDEIAVFKNTVQYVHSMTIIDVI